VRPERANDPNDEIKIMDSCGSLAFGCLVIFVLLAFAVIAWKIFR